MEGGTVPAVAVSSEETRGMDQGHRGGKSGSGKHEGFSGYLGIPEPSPSHSGKNQ